MKFVWMGLFAVAAGLGIAWMFQSGEETVAIVQADKAAEQIQLAQADLGTPAVHPALWIQENDRVLGDRNAPVTLIEYSSMTCPHCGTFHNDYLPEIEKKFIETGKVKFVMRPLPWDNMALGISKVTMCAPKDQYYMLLKAFFRSQRDWIRSADPLAEIKKIALFAGLDGPTVESCVKDADLNEEVLGIKEVAQQVLKVNATPTFFINGERLENLRSFSDVADALETAVEQSKQNG